MIGLMVCICNHIGLTQLSLQYVVGKLSWKMRKLCRELNWDTLTEEEREDFINHRVHEDRECNQ